MSGGGFVLFTLMLIVYTVNAHIDFDLTGLNVTLSGTTGSYGNYSELCEPYYTKYNTNELEAIDKKMNDLNISTVWLNIRRITLSDFTWLNGQIYDPVWGGKGFYCSMFQVNSDEMIYLSKCTSKLEYALCDRNNMHAGTNSKCSTTNSDAKCYSLDNLPYILLRIESGNWFDAVNQCNKMYSALASIPTTYNTTILPVINSAISLLNIGHVSAWIGLRKQEFQYYTSANSSESVTKYYWEYSSPCQDGDCTGKDCVVQQRSQNRFIWKADKCTSHHHFICIIKQRNSTRANSIREERGNAKDDIGLSIAAIAGIITVAVFVVIIAIITVTVVCCCIKRKRQNSKGDSELNDVSQIAKPLLPPGTPQRKDGATTSRLPHEGLEEIHKQLAECLTTGEPTEEPKPKDVQKIITTVFREVVHPCEDGTLESNDIKHALKRWRNTYPEMKLETLCDSLVWNTNCPGKLKLLAETWRERTESDDVEEMKTSDEAANITDHIYRKDKFKIPEDVWTTIMDGLVECLTSRIPCKDESICKQVHLLNQRIIKSKLPDWGLYCTSAAEQMVDEWMKNKDLDGVKADLERVSNNSELKDLAGLINSYVKL